jgi:predicted phage tail protein
VNLRWVDNSGNEIGFIVERSADGGKSWGKVAWTGANATGFSDLSVAARKTYKYRVKAVNEAGSSAYVLASATTPARPLVRPPAPSALRVTAVSSRQVSLRWADNARTEIGYVVERSSDGGRTWSRIAQTAVNATTFVDRRIAVGQDYRYRVRAINEAGLSGFMVVRTKTPAILAVAADTTAASYASYAKVAASSSARTAGADVAMADLPWVSRLGQRDT